MGVIEVRLMVKRIELPTNPKKVQQLNKACWNDGRTVQGANFFTFGYSGRSTDEIFEAVRQAGVSTVVDIRFTPLSMYRPDFSKRNLERIVKSHGLDYLHLRWLGVPREIRARAAEAGDLKVIWDWYDDEVVASFLGRNLNRFFKLASHPLALMCTETDPNACHRHRLFLALEDRGMQGFDL
ncbi:MAG: DUF488 domain-containing protein [Chloroflexi bacterium]|nr:DUF488 domain-containing protein [Chloroflexota bacterium]